MSEQAQPRFRVAGNITLKPLYIFRLLQQDDIRQTPTNHPRKSIINLAGFQKFFEQRRLSMQSHLTNEISPKNRNATAHYMS